MAKKKFNLNLPPGATTSSSVRNVSNSGQMSTSTQSTGATGSVRNETRYVTTQGAPGSAGTPNIIGTPPGAQAGETPGPWNWMDDAITKALRGWPRS